MKKIESFLSILSGFFIAIVFLVTFAQVVQRYVLHIPIPWANDVIRISFIYSVFLGMAVGVFKKAHINVDVLVNALPSRIKGWSAILTNIIVLLFLCVVLYFSYSFTLANRDQYTTYLFIPMSYVYAIVPISVFLMVVFLILDTIKIFISVLKYNINEKDNCNI